MIGTPLHLCTGQATHQKYSLSLLDEGPDSLATATLTRVGCGGLYIANYMTYDILCLRLCPRSSDYGHTFVNDTSKWDIDTVIEWYYISPYSEYVSGSTILNF